MIVDKAGIIEFYRNNPSEDSQSRIENIQEFFGVVDEYRETHEDADALFEAPKVGEDQSAETPPVRVFEAVRFPISSNGHAPYRHGHHGRRRRGVTLMTIHSAKGLEFDCVFVAA